MEEMQNELQEYRSRGAAASREVQVAARQVARENRRLRAMLALRGVSSDEIQAFLQLPDETVDALDAAKTLHPAETGIPASVPARLFHGRLQALEASNDNEPEQVGDRALEPDVPDAPTHGPTTPLETSCTAAADLIADLHGHIPVAKALMMLGCSGTTDCRVKNTTVLQLIDGVL